MTYEWLARDRNGDLWLFEKEPTEKDDDGLIHFVSEGGVLDAIEIDCLAFPEIENGTKRRVKIEVY